MRFLLIFLPILLTSCINIERVSAKPSRYQKSAEFKGEFVESNQLTEKIKIIKKKDPKLPRRLNNRSYHTPGFAVVELIVKMDGKPVQIQTVRATDSGHATAAVRCVKEWKFEPGRMAGRKVDARMTVELNFATQMNRLRSLKSEKYRDPPRQGPYLGR